MPVDKKFVEEMVKAHNDYRKIHQDSSIKHAEDLTENAQKWADHLVATGSSEHTGGKIEEDIFTKWSISSGDYSGKEVTENWYKEIQDHTPRAEPRSTAIGRFWEDTWKGLIDIGVGKATGKDGKTIVVASYRPAVNMLGGYAAFLPASR